MGFFQKLFGQAELVKPDIHFGRYSDAFRSPNQLSHWEQAMVDFDQFKYVSSIKHVLEYIKNENVDNLNYTEVDGQLRFTILQGSKIVEGVVGPEYFSAESKIAHAKTLNIGFLRNALESNYELRYGCYALRQDNTITLIFDSYLEESSPYKIFYGLREIAIQADRQDDILIHDFPELEAINSMNIIALPEKEKQIKISFFKTEVQRVLSKEILGSLNADRFQGALTYFFLDSIYRIDYLLKPESKIMDMIDGMHRNYFADHNLDPAIKVAALRKKFQEMGAMEDKELDPEFYNVIDSFGVTNKVNMSTINPILESELKAWDWYYENKHFVICDAICGYVVGYCLFCYTLPEPTRALMHLYYEITETNYFKALGFNLKFYLENGQFNTSAIEGEVDQILRNYDKSYPSINKKYELDFSSKSLFLKSYLSYLQNLNIP